MLCAQDTVAPQFRSGTEIVRIEVTALDRERHVVRGLSAADFDVRVDGQPQPIAAFAAVDLPVRRTPVTTAAWLRDVAPDVTTNTTSDEGRLVVIFFDRSIPAGPKLLTARRIAAAAVEALGPVDLAAVTSVWPGTAQGFTADRSRLLRAIQAASPGSAPTDDERAANSRIFASQPDTLAKFDAHESCFCNVCVLDRIREIADTVRTAARPKLLLFIGTQLTISAGDITPADPMSRSAAECSGPIRDARDRMYRALDQSGLTIHSFDPSGLETTPMAQALQPRNALQPDQRTFVTRQQLFVLPELTGGRVVVDTNDPQAFVADALEESASYYVIGFRAVRPGADPVHVDIKSSRPGVAVHARRSFVSAIPVGADASHALGVAVAGALPDRGLPLALQAMPMKLSSGNVLVVLGLSGFESAARGAPPPSHDRLVADILFTAVDLRARKPVTDRRTVEVAGSGTADVVSSLALAPGTYEVRAGAALSGGRIGSVVTYIDVQDFDREAVSLSGVVLSAEPADPAAVVGGVGDQLPLTPTTRREFRTTDTVKAFVKVYEGVSDRLRPVTIDTLIADAVGQVVVSSTHTLEPTRFESRSADYGLQLPLAALGPGSYLLRIGATLDSQHATRDVRFVTR